MLTGSLEKVSANDCLAETKVHTLLPQKVLLLPLKENSIGLFIDAEGA